MKRSQVLLATVLGVAVMAASVILSACGGGGGGSTSPGGGSSGKVQLSGTIATGTKPKPFAIALQAPSFAVSSIVDSVWAIPIAKMQGANIDPVNFMLRKTTPIAVDGSFSFELDRTITMADIVARIPTMDTGGWPLDTVFEVDWMLVQMKNNAPVKVIRLQGDTTYDSMMSIPLSAFTPSSMNLGTVTDGDGLATLTVTGIANNVTLSSGSLATIAKTDDILGTITDIIRNCDINNNKCKSAQQSFAFTGVYSALANTTSYDIGGKYQGYQLYFDLNDYFSKADFDGICPTSGSPTVVYTLAPPQPVSIQSVTYSIGSPMTTSATSAGVRSDINSGAYTQCFKNTEPLYLRKSNTTNDWILQFVTGDQANQLITAFPAGDWVLSRNSATIARFEFSLAKPVDANGKPIIIVPGIQLVLDGTANKGVNAINVKWYQWNGSAYAQVTDAALLNSLMGGFEISMDDNDGITGAPSRRSIQMNNINFATTSVDVSTPSDLNGKFYYNYGLQDKYKLEYLGLGYQFGGQSFRFVWATYIP